MKSLIYIQFFYVDMNENCSQIASYISQIINGDLELTGWFDFIIELTNLDPKIWQIIIVVMYRHILWQKKGMPMRAYMYGYNYFSVKVNKHNQHLIYMSLQWSQRH